MEAAYVLPQRISMVDPFRYAAADAIWRRTVAGPSPLQQEHQGKAKPSRSLSLIWNVKAHMSSFR